MERSSLNWPAITLLALGVITLALVIFDWFMLGAIVAAGGAMYANHSAKASPKGSFWRSKKRLLAGALFLLAIALFMCAAVRVEPVHAADLLDTQTLAQGNQPATEPTIIWSFQTIIGLLFTGLLLIGGVGSQLTTNGRRINVFVPMLMVGLVGLLLVWSTGCAAKQLPPPEVKIEVTPVGRQNCAMSNVAKFEAAVTTAEAAFTRVKEKAAELSKQILEVDNPALEAKITELQGQLDALPVPTPDLDEAGKPRNKEELDTYRVQKSKLELGIATARLQIAANLKRIRDIEAKRDELYAALEAAKKNLAEENECLTRKAAEATNATNAQSGEAAKAPALK